MLEGSILCNMVIPTNTHKQVLFPKSLWHQDGLGCHPEHSSPSHSPGVAAKVPWLGEEVRKDKAAQTELSYSGGWLQDQVGSRPRRMRRTEVGLTEEGVGRAPVSGMAEKIGKAWPEKTCTWEEYTVWGETKKLLLWFKSCPINATLNLMCGTIGQDQDRWVKIWRKQHRTHMNQKLLAMGLSMVTVLPPREHSRNVEWLFQLLIQSQLSICTLKYTFLL